MEEHVNGGLETFFRGLADDYLLQNEQQSFLYRAFWRKNVAGLLKMLDEMTLNKKKIFPELLEKLDGNFRQLPENRLPENGLLQEENRSKTKGRLDFYNFVCQLEPKHEPWIKEQLEKFFREHKQLLKELLREHRQHPEKLTGEQKRSARCLPLKKKARWDFWTELWLNDAWYKAKLITDTEYYLWLTECLTAHSDYYADKNVWVGDGHTWLYVLLMAGLRSTALDPCKIWGEELRGNDFEKKSENNLDKEHAEKELAELAELIRGVPRDPEAAARDTKGARKAGLLLRNLTKVSIHCKINKTTYDQKDINVRTKAQVGKDLAALTKMMQEEKDNGGREIACRLQGLKYPEENRDNSARWVEYLPWLTGQLERMALHSDIKTWLQDSGYTIVEKNNDDQVEYEIKKSSLGPRRLDFIMRLFEEYYDGTENHGFNRRDQEAEAASGSLDWGSMGFCVLEPDRHETLRRAMEQSGKTDFYIPLAVDLRSGCIFFLAGKDNYGELYDNPKTKKERDDKKAYVGTKTNCCFDYFRLDEEALMSAEHIGTGKSFRLEPVFHLNAKKKAGDVLAEFKRYCMRGENGPRQTIREFNMKMPDGIPEAFCFVFEKSAGRKQSPSSVDAFRRDRIKSEEQQRSLNRQVG